MGKVVIVTGGSGGIGREIAAQFGLTGAKVLVNYHANKSDAEAAAEQVRKNGGEAEIFQADVCNYSQVQAMGEFAAKKWGGIDVLAHCAGGGAHKLGGGDQLILEMDEALWETVIRVNLTGTFICIKAIAPFMIEQKGGHIINISSGSGLKGRAGRSSYAAAKAGVFGLTKSAARELGEYNVKINAVCPGRIRHKRWTAAGKPVTKPNNVLGRESGTAEEFAKFIVHLSTMDNISGQTLNVDSSIF